MRLDSLIQDIRYALRGLRKKPGFTAAVVLTLALGIGANAAMFGVTDRLLFRPPAMMSDPDRVHRVFLVRTFDGTEDFGEWFQYTRFKDLERWTSSFDVAAAMTDPNPAIGVGTDAREMRIGAVSAGFWKLFDAQPVLGRFFTPAEDTTPAGAQVAVLSHAFWQTQYGGRADVLGERIKIARADYEIIGVLPPEFTGLSERNAVLYVPITAWGANEMAFNPRDPNNWFQKYNISWMQMVVRRKPGVTQAAADADLSAAHQRSYRAGLELSPGGRPMEVAKPRAVAASILPARGPNATQVSKVARWVSGVAIIVLLVAAANVANLLLARALQRRREVAVRLALGVSRKRLLAQLLTESLVLAVLGGIAGILVAQWGGAILRSQFLPAGQTVSVFDMRTLLFAGAAVVFVGLVTGLAPALQSGRGDLTSALKSGAREGTYHRSRTRIALLVLQGALSVILLVGAGLFVRSLSNVRGLDMGYDMDRLLWVNVRERGERLDEHGWGAVRNQLEAAARTLPQVEHASRAVTVPFMMFWNESIFVPGHDTAFLNALGSINIQGANADYFRTMGTRLLRGRGIEPTDRQDAPPVMVVSEKLATVLWPGADPIGKCVRAGADTAPCTEVVGVAENIRTSSDFSDDNQLYYYRPIEQVDRDGGGLFVRVRGDAEQQAEAVRRALQPLMPGSSYVTVQPMATIYGPNVRSWRLGATMFVAFGALALVLAAIGLYSVIAYNVTQRTHELGVRVAFGAQVGDVVGLVMREGLQLTVLGIGIGIAAAAFAGRWVAPLLFEVSPTDPLVFAIVAGVLLLAAVMASLFPARRAARVDPNVALRSD